MENDLTLNIFTDTRIIISENRRWI